MDVLSSQEHIYQAHRELEHLSEVSPDAFAAERNRRFRRLLEHHACNMHNTRYAELLRSHGLGPQHDLPSDLGSIDRLPLVDRRFLMEANYTDRPAVPAAEVANRISSSGTTTGNPLRLPISFATRTRFYVEMMIRCFILMGASHVLEENSYFVAHYTPEDMETGTYIVFNEYRKLMGDRVAIGSTRASLDEHLRRLFGHRPRYGSSSGQFFLHLVALANEHGIDLSHSTFDYFLAGSAPLVGNDAEILRKGLGLQRLAMIYVSTETGFMGIQPVMDGSYIIFDDDYILEVIDEEGHHVAPGERGRLAVTSFACDAAPMIRYLIGDEATYLGQDSTFPNCTAITAIGRSVGAIIGAGKVAYEEIVRMPHEMTLRGASALAAQLVRRKTPDRRDQVIIRVESPLDDVALVTEVAIAVFRLNYQMDELITNREIPLPIVEVYRPGQLRAGALKLRPFIDEAEPVVIAAQTRPGVA
jgi:phenylacetate-coenzyme A ligase PaaK-like adenylate-forming protein